MSVKEAIIQHVAGMPDDITWDEILYRLYLLETVEESRTQIREGKCHSHEEVKEIVKEWLR